MKGKNAKKPKKSLPAFLMPAGAKGKEKGTGPPMPPPGDLGKKKK